VAATRRNAGIVSTVIVVIAVDRSGLTTINFATPELETFVFVSRRTIDLSMVASVGRITSVKSTSIIIAVYLLVMTSSKRTGQQPSVVTLHVSRVQAL